MRYAFEKTVKLKYCSVTICLSERKSTKFFNRAKVMDALAASNLKLTYFRSKVEYSSPQSLHVSV